MGRPQASFVKRQREQQRKEKAAAKAEKRQQKKGEKGETDDMFEEVVREESITS
jgi:hypothetical protein